MSFSFPPRRFQKLSRLAAFGMLKKARESEDLQTSEQGEVKDSAKGA
jgi:hypothetical protein